MNKIVDIYLPLDSRETANAEVWPVTKGQLKELISVIESCGWTAHVLNPDNPVASVAEGMQVIRKAKGSRFINFMGGWAYPDFSVSPTHPANMRSYFGNKDHSDRKEMLQEVKKVLIEDANINLDNYPLVTFILDHPGQADELYAYYRNLQNGFNSILDHR